MIVLLLSFLVEKHLVFALNHLRNISPAYLWLLWKILTFLLIFIYWLIYEREYEWMNGEGRVEGNRMPFAWMSTVWGHGAKARSWSSSQVAYEWKLWLLPLRCLGRKWESRVGNSPRGHVYLSSRAHTCLFSRLGSSRKSQQLSMFFYYETNVFKLTNIIPKHPKL